MQRAVIYHPRAPVAKAFHQGSLGKSTTKSRQALPESRLVPPVLPVGTRRSLVFWHLPSRVWYIQYWNLWLTFEGNWRWRKHLSCKHLPSDGKLFRQFSSNMLLWWQSTPYESQFNCSPWDHAGWRIPGFQRAVREKHLSPADQAVEDLIKHSDSFSFTMTCWPCGYFLPVSILTDHSCW